MKPKSPCLDCVDRHLGCHAECEKYLEFKNKSDEQRERIFRERERENISMSYIQEDVRKKRRKLGVK